MKISGNLAAKVKTGIKAGMLGLAILPVQLPALAKDTVQFSHSAAATSGLTNFNAKLANKAEIFMKNISEPFKSEKAVLTGETGFNPKLIQKVQDPYTGTRWDGKIKNIETNNSATYKYEYIDKSLLLEDFNLDLSNVNRAFGAGLKKDENSIVTRIEYNPFINELGVNISLTGFYQDSKNLIKEERYLYGPEKNFEIVNTSYYYTTDGTGFKKEMVYKIINDGKTEVIGEQKYFRLGNKGEDGKNIKTEISIGEFEKGVQGMFRDNYFDLLLDDFEFNHP